MICISMYCDTLTEKDCRCYVTAQQKQAMTSLNKELLLRNKYVD
jgi:hypothetical protein